MKITREEVAMAVTLMEDDLTVRYAACAVGKPEATVHKALQRYRETHIYSQLCCLGRSSAQTVRQTDEWFEGTDDTCPRIDLHGTAQTSIFRSSTNLDRRVLSLDESRFCFRLPDGRHRVGRRWDERISAASVVQKEMF
ncbi:hypothetical protein ILUMI_11258 [Ignelater luminosus]|uniref:Uncharacterized protein n=1 Tax=Ignelater luminosus TaxID=2038154 RepID=A0A8K0GDE4_IGNLU|nr:hypothetical protein ILUMI_11258 [Ignelater luminosus]